MSLQSLCLEDCRQPAVSNITNVTNAQSVYCICCLDTNVPLLSLISCDHSEYLDSFSKPELKPDSQVVCIRCHVILKKIQSFKQQVQNSFSILSDKSTNTGVMTKRHNLNIHKAVEIQINGNNNIDSIIKTEAEPQIIKTESLKRSNKKIDNIKAALDIIQSNHNIGFVAASVLNANSILKLTSSLMDINVNNFHKHISGYDEVAPKRIRLESEDNNEDINFDTENQQPFSTEFRLNSTEILADSNVLQPELNSIQTELNPIQPEINPIHPETNIITLESNVLPTYSNTLQPETSYIQLRSNEIPLHSDTIQSDSNQVESNSNPIQLHSNQIQPDPNKNQPNMMNRPELNANLNKTSNIPRKYKNKLNVVRLSDAELKLERVVQSKTLSYLACKFKCMKCIMGFKYQDNLDNHMKRKHSVESGSFVCNVCSQRFSTDEEYEFHVLTHYNRFQCVKCKKRFQIWDEALTHYQNAHVDNKKLKSQKQLSKKREGTLHKCHCQH